LARALADGAASKPAASARRWGDLRLRVLSAAVLAPSALFCLWTGGWLWTALVAAGTIGMFAEWIAMCRGKPAWLRAAGVPYVGLAAAALVWLRFDPAVGRMNVLFVVLMVWASDIGAYLVGRFAGGPKLAPSISPGKTWSGAIGGMATAILVGAALASGSLARVALVAAGLSVVSQLGDLLESALKRRFGVKDSGRLIPGHGGLLDRLDGMLTAAPAAALLAMALGRGIYLWQ
jgi:phosphatidate cytidylyltransferase